ncbi:MAG TPA: universal stress protein [Polyangiaceae bacterium]|nr:universal stress protein [Polyangiaceae bacterium]
MNTFKHILVPTDFGPASAEAVELAVTLAGKFGSEVTLLHVWEIPVYPYMEFVLDSGELVDSVEKAAAHRLAEVLGDVQQRLPGAKSVLKMGLDWQQIVDIINAIKPDLVIMGTHGRRGLSHALLGSVAEKVVRLSPAPVLTTHAT